MIAYLDVESALDEHLAIDIYGIDPARLFIVRPDISTSAEEVLDIMVDCAMSDAFCGVILDSVAGLVTSDEMKASASASSSYAPVAKLLATQIKKLDSRQDPDAAAVICTNHMKPRIGGPGFTTNGGGSMEFYPSLRLRLRKGDPIKSGADEIGFTTRAQAVKSRYSRQRVVTSWAVIYGDEGISTLRAVVTVAMEQKLIVQSGSWFSIAGTEITRQGMEALLGALREDPSLFQFVTDNLQTVCAEIE